MPRFFWRHTAAVVLSILISQPLLSAPPAWWGPRYVTPAELATQRDDFAVANIGQVKTLASKAAQEMNAAWPGFGAGTAINNLITFWTAPPAAGVVRDDYAAVNAGQLKSIAKLFYDRLFAHLGVQAPAGQPWPLSAQSADDFAVVNIGQVKSIFAFPIPVEGQLPTKLTNVQQAVTTYSTLLSSGTPDHDQITGAWQALENARLLVQRLLDELGFGDQSWLIDDILGPYQQGLDAAVAPVSSEPAVLITGRYSVHVSGTTNAEGEGGSISFNQKFAGNSLWHPHVALPYSGIYNALTFAPLDDRTRWNFGVTHDTQWELNLGLPTEDATWSGYFFSGGQFLGGMVPEVAYAAQDGVQAYWAEGREIWLQSLGPRKTEFKKSCILLTEQGQQGVTVASTAMAVELKVPAGKMVSDPVQLVPPTPPPGGWSRVSLLPLEVEILQPNVQTDTEWGDSTTAWGMNTDEVKAFKPYGATATETKEMKLRISLGGSTITESMKTQINYTLRAFHRSREALATWRTFNVKSSDRISPDGRQIWVTLDESEWRSVMPPDSTDQPYDEATSYDYAKATVGGNYNDSAMFETMLVQSFLWGASAQTGYDKGNWQAAEKASAEGTMRPWVTACTREAIEHAGMIVVETSSGRRAAAIDQADWFYYSGHGYHEDASLDAISGARVFPADVKWQDDLDVAIIAGCSVLDINDLNNNYSGAGHTVSPGKLWADAGPTYLLGYNYKAPTDAQGSDTIIKSWIQKAGFNKTDEWGKANDTLAGHHACAIFAGSGLKFYYYFKKTALGPINTWKWTQVSELDW